jgi:hypothetical protein
MAKRRKPRIAPGLSVGYLQQLPPSQQAGLSQQKAMVVAA